MKLKITIGVLALMLTIGCRNASNNNEQATSNDSLSVSQTDKKTQSVYYRFPTPDELFTFIKKENIKYNPEILNPVNNISKYVNSKAQTIALGVYLTDLSYITLFESYNNSLEYYKAVHSLSEKIKITSAYDLSVSKRIEKNLLNLDSLKKISADSYAGIVEFLIMNNREKTLALIASGAYVECFYLTVKLTDKNEAQNPLKTRVADFKYAFENLYSYLTIYSDDKQVAQVAEQLKGIHELFTSIKSSKKTKTKVRQDKEGNLIFEGGSKLEITAEQYSQLKEMIFAVRKSFIE